jgi:SecD/SecF fusion protein
MAWNHSFPLIIAQAAADAGAEGGMSPVLKLVIAAAVIVGSFALGAFIARRLRMPDYSFKIGLLLFTLSASMVVNIVGWPPKRGIDLSGGVVLVYEVDRELSKPSRMQTIIARVNEHLNVGGGEKLEARPGQDDQIEVTLPAGTDPARVERAILDLRTTADVTLHNAGKRTEDGKTVLVYSVDQQQKSVDMDKLIAAVGRRINPSGVKELTIRQYGAEQLEVIIPEIDEREVDQIKRRISTSGLLEFRIVANERDDKDIIKAAAKSPGRDVYIGGHLAGRWVQLGPEMKDVAGATVRQTESRGKEILVRIDPFNVDGRYLDRAAPGFDQGSLAVNFSFDTTGAEKFGQLTKRNLPDPATPDFKRRLGIILDNVMLSAPNINSAIYGDGQITGNFTQEEVEFLVGVLNAGSLPASLRPDPISQQRISSQLGDDTIRRGSESMIISTVAILVFMLVYYRFCGIVADVAVVLNMVVTVALMILIKAAFTLPGLAGLVLTVGMAVDANVLIYERMREETERGASLRMAIRNGFSRAMATIIDSHVTTLVSAMVLYVIGTDQIKGFAVTLILGLLMSLFTAVYVARVIFDVAEKKRWLTRLKMLHLIGHTNIDFIRWLNPAIAGSVIIIVVGLAATGMRGAGILDIDFTGGSSVQLLFANDKKQDIADVRRAVAHLPDVAVSSVGDNNLEFKVDTSEKDIKKVQDELKQTFGKSLLKYDMEFGALSTIEAEKSEDKPASEAAPAASTPDESKEAPAPAAETPAKPDGEAAPKNVEPTAPETPKSEKPETAGLGLPNGERIAHDGASFNFASAGREQVLTALLLARAEPAGPPAEDEKKAEPALAPEPKPAATASAESPIAEPKAKTSGKPAATAPEQPIQPAGSTRPGATEDAAAGETGPTMVGGTRVTLKFPQDISYGPLREMVDRELAELKLSNVTYELRNPKYQLGSDARYPEWTLEITLKQDQTLALLKLMQDRLANTPVFPSSNQIGAKVAGDTQLMALYALLASMAIIVVYIWIRFQNVMFGLAAVLALVHDVLVTVAFLAMSYYLSPYLGWLLVDPFKISLAVVAALLTIVGFSINDTIVVFDRIREVRGKSPDLTEDMINLSVNATLSRTLLTSGTVMIASVILYFVGGPGIHAFAYSMVVGVVAGTYSSVYIAAPVLLWMKKPPARSAKPSEAIQPAAAGPSRNHH